MWRTIRLSRTLLKTATTLALVALTAGTALAAPSVYSQNSAQEASQTVTSDGIGGESDTQIPDSITKEHWAYKYVAELGEKYGAATKLNEEQPVSKNELVDKFIIALARIAETYDKEGGQAISRDDLESARRLIVALEDELFGQPAYRTIRTTIEQLLSLVEPAVPLFKYKAGVNGFLRGEGAGNFKLADMSYAPDRDAGRLLYRVKPFVYWRPNNYLDVQLEGQGYGFTGEGSHDSRDFNLYQGFVEAKLPSGDAPGKNLLALKAGRQEFNYGSGFILGTDTFFNGLTFDALRLRVQPSVNWFNFLTVDLLAGKYATPFSDGIRGDLLGAYLTYQPADDSTIEAYAFRDTGAEERFSGEHLNTLGYRSTSKVGMFGMEYELAYQTGKLFNGTSNDNIAAYGGHVDLTGDFSLRAFENSYKSSVFLSFAMGSGDKNAVDGTSFAKEFRNSNNDTSLVGDMHVVGDLSGIDVGDHHASGMQVYTLGWGIDLSRKLNFSATGRKFMADKVEAGFSRDVGVETDFTLTYIHNKDYALIVGYDHFFTGKFFRDAVGSDKDINYAFAMLQFNYDWTKRKR
ncbi:MAG: alginate export family protein [Geobacteraceae bacterium]|nr:alginate export family protein [Geobacteraceae bacterium]